MKPNINRQTFGRAFYSYSAYDAQDKMYDSGTPELGSFLDTHDIEIRESVQTPNFRNLKPSQRPMNPYRVSIFKVRDPISSFSQRNQDGSYHTDLTISINCQWFLPKIAQFGAAYADDPTQKAVSRLISQIGTAKADTGTTFAELGKTASHLLKTAEKVAGALIALRKGRFGDFSKVLGVSYTKKQHTRFRLKHAEAKLFDKKRGFWYDQGKFSTVRQQSRVTDLVADTWLEYSYAWKPLLSDVRSHAEALATAMTDHSGVMRTISTSAKGETFRLKSVGDLSNGEGTYVITREITNSVKYILNYRIPNGSISPLHAFGLSNPLTVAWEIVPFSFVVDWFIPIGNALSALSAFNGLEFHSGVICRRTIEKATQEISLISYTAGTTSVVRTHNMKSTLESFDASRTPLAGFPAYGVPSFKDPRSLSHGASAIALLQSLFLRK